jgi:hypothetical protein
VVPRDRAAEAPTRPDRAPEPPVDVDHVRDWFDRIQDRAIRSDARRVAAALVTSTPNRRLRRIDHQMRERSQWLAPTGARLTASDVDGFAGEDENRWPIVGLCAMHRDGYVREEALRCLALGPSEIVAPFVLLRTDDWVEPVRVLATRLTLEFTGKEPDKLLSALPVIWDRLMVAGQEGRALPAIESLRSFLADQQTRPYLRHAVQTSTDRWVIRIALHVLLEVESPETVHRLVGNTTDLAVAIQTARACLAAEPDPRTVDDLLASRFPAVRSAAAFWAFEHLPDSKLERQILRDRSRSVREQGQRQLAREGRDPRQWYLARLTTEPDDTASLLGLGDVATADDEPLGLAETRSPDPFRRVASVAVLGRSTSGSATQRLVELVGDAAPRVSRAASDALRGRPIPLLEIERLIELAESSEEQARNVRRAVSDLPRWQRLIVALRLCDLQGLAGEQGRSLLGVVLRDWQRSSTTPTDSELEQAKSLATSVRGSLGPSLAAQLETELRWEH